MELLELDAVLELAPLMELAPHLELVPFDILVKLMYPAQNYPIFFTYKNSNYIQPILCWKCDLRVHLSKMVELMTYVTTTGIGSAVGADSKLKLDHKLSL